MDFQVYAFRLLPLTDHRKQVARLGIPIRPEHAHETFARLFENPGQFLKPDRRVDIVTQYRFADIDITGKQALDPFLQQDLAEREIPSGTRRNSTFKIFHQRHLTPLAVSDAYSRTRALLRHKFRILAFLGTPTSLFPVYVIPGVDPGSTL